METQAYDLLLEGAMRAQHFHSRNLRLNGPWKWLLDAFADYYGVSNSYARLRYFECHLGAPKNMEKRNSFLIFFMLHDFNFSPLTCGGLLVDIYYM